MGLLDVTSHLQPMKLQHLFEEGVAVLVVEAQYLLNAPFDQVACELDEFQSNVRFVKKLVLRLNVAYALAD